jgi:hypothetical protein
VAWVRPSSATTPLKSPGAGIEFLDLDSKVAALLTRLVEPDDERRQSVDVWFEGMTAPIRCHANIVGGGLRLETRLPFMRIASAVKVAFTQESPPSTREGIVDGVSLEPNQSDGVPFLRVAVTMPPLDSAQGTIEARANGKSAHDPAVELGSTLVDPAVSRANGGNTGQGPVMTSRRDRSENTHRIAIDEIVPPVDTTGRVWAQPVVGVIKRGGRAFYAIAGVALGALLVWGLQTRGPAVDRSAGGAPIGSGKGAEAPSAKPVVAGSQPAISLAPAAAAKTKPVAAGPQAGGAPLMARTSSAATSASVTAPGVAPAAPESAPVAGPEIEPLAPPAAADAKKGVTFTTDANRNVVISVPLEGNTARTFTRNMQYGDRGMVGVALLKARPHGSVGVGVVQPAGSPRVLIRRRGTGSLVRVAFESRKYNAKVVQDGDFLRLMLAPRTAH